MKTMGNLNLQFGETSSIPISGNTSFSRLHYCYYLQFYLKIITHLFDCFFRSLVLDSPSTESHVSNSVNSSEIEGKYCI